MPYRLAIFDLDGTLADSFRWFLCVVNDVADRFKFKRIEAHEVEALRDLSARDMVRHLEVPAWKLPLIARHTAAGVQIAIVSSNSESNVRSLLGPELAARVDYYACGASLFGKARKIRQTLWALGVPRPHAILIGDEIRDYEAAHRAGVAFGAVEWGYTSPEALRALGASALFMEPREILNRLVPAIERKAH